MNNIEDLSQLRTMFAETVAGSGRLALIRGGLATGKTELLLAFLKHSADYGALVLTATGVPTERTLRMGVVWQLFRSAGRVPEPLDEDAFDGPDAGPVQCADARAVRDVCLALLDLAEDRPIVIAVDDLQFVDSMSLQVLLYLRRRISSERLMLVFAEWKLPGLARPLLRAELTRAPHGQVNVGVLSESAVTEHLARHLGQSAAARLSPGYYALSGGNPLLVSALVEDHDRRTAGESEAETVLPLVGDAFRQAVLDCLHRWDPDLHTVAAGLAILGERAEPDVLGELTGMSSPAVSRILDVLRTAGLVTSDRLRHNEITATVLGSMSSEDAARLHLRAAEILYKRGFDVRDIAGHIVAAGSVPGPWAVRMLQHAADQLAIDDPGRAVTCLELAMRDCDDEHDLAALRTSVVRIAWRANPSVAARHLPALRDKLFAGELGWPDAVPVIRYRLWQGDLPAAARQLRAVWESAGPADARTTAELRLAGEWIYGDLRDRVPNDVWAMFTAGRAGTPVSPWRRTAALHARLARGAGADVSASAEHILQGCLGDMPPEVGAAALLALDDVGPRDRARIWCERLLDEAARRRATTWRAVLSGVRAELAWRRGDLLGARARAGAALDMLPAQGWGVLIGFPLSTLVLVGTAMGKPAAAVEWLDRAVPEAMFGTAFGARYLHARGHHYLATGRTLAAVDDFEQCGALIGGRDHDIPPVVPWRSDLAQAYLRVGMRSQAKELVQEQLNRLGSGGSARMRARSLRVLASCVELHKRAELLREVIRVVERCADRLELIRALADLSQVHRDLGELGSARMVMRNAEQLARSCRAGILPVRQEPVAMERSANGLVTPELLSGGMIVLSQAERKVAVLAANGHTNREIGRMLYITISTVEQHLTRVYKKLKVGGRADLAAEILPSRQPVR